MKKDELSRTPSNAEKELIVQGCQSYLDIVHAINAFEIRVCREARRTIDDSRKLISEVAALETPVGYSANDYVSRSNADNNFDGSNIWVGASLWLAEPTLATLYVALVFSRNSKGERQKPEVYFALKVGAKYRLTELRKIFANHPNSHFSEEWDWLALEISQPLDDPCAFPEGFATILTDALKCWKESSLKKGRGK